MELVVKVIIPDVVVEQARKLGTTEEQLRHILNSRITAAVTEFIGDIALRHAELFRKSPPPVEVEISHTNNISR